MYALTEAVAKRRELGAISIRAHLCDESVERVPERRIVRLSRQRGSRAVVCLVGVQTSQFPRAADLARRFRRRGIQVLIGGFHVSGVLDRVAPVPAHVRKRQNRVDDYAALIDTWRAAGVLTHVGYIIGLPHDTPDSVRAAIRMLQREIGVDIASFFMLTPLPGAADYKRMTGAGVAMDADFNRYDTFHPVIDHPRMSRATWYTLYEEAWRTFYTREHMRRQLSSVSPEQYVTLLQMYLWYLAAIDVDHFHPMMTGFFRHKPRVDRRPGSIVNGRLQHLRHRAPELWSDLRGYARTVQALHRLWLDTCPRGDRSLGYRPGSQSHWWPFLRTMFGAGGYDAL